MLNCITKSKLMTFQLSHSNFNRLYTNFPNPYHPILTKIILPAKHKFQQLKNMSNTKSAQDLVKSLVKLNHYSNHINYMEYRSNHVVHGMCTLMSLGASAKRIQAYYDNYSKQLEPRHPPGLEIDDTNWEQQIGNKKGYDDLVPFFDSQVDHLGIEGSLTKFVLRVLPGFPGGLYHPLIHIGFGIEFQFRHVLAEGLAYSCTYYSKVGDIINRLSSLEDTESLTPVTIVTRWSHSNVTLPESNRVARDAIVDQHDTYSQLGELVGKWKVDEIATADDVMAKLAELTEAVLMVTFGSYKNHKIDFYLMHAFTSLQAVRTLLPHLGLSEQRRLLQVSLVALLTYVWLEGMPGFDLERILDYGKDSDSMSWEVVKRKAVACDDEHVAKVVRGLLVVKENVEDDLIPHELLLRCGAMTTDFLSESDDDVEEHWEFDGIGFVN